MAIMKGHPVVWQDVVDAVTTHYPEYAAYIAVDQKNTPLLAQPANVPFILLPPLAVLLAMVSPPNMAVRDIAVGSFFLIEDQIVGPFSEWSVTAPDVFLDQESGTYTDIQAAGDDMNAQIDSYKAAHPNFRMIGYLRSFYEDPTILPDPLILARDKVVGKNVS